MQPCLLTEVGCFSFTKHPILRKSTTILLLFAPFFLGHAHSGAFSGDLSHCEDLGNDVAAVAQVLYAEARGESEEGRLAIIFAIRNRAMFYNEPIWKTCRRGMKQGMLTPTLVDEAMEGLRVEVGHDYRHWMNPRLATDLNWKDYAMKQDGLMIGEHFFF